MLEKTSNRHSRVVPLAISWNNREAAEVGDACSPAAGPVDGVTVRAQHLPLEENSLLCKKFLQN